MVFPAYLNASRHCETPSSYPTGAASCKLTALPHPPLPPAAAGHRPTALPAFAPYSPTCCMPLPPHDRTLLEQALECLDATPSRPGSSSRCCVRLCTDVQTTALAAARTLAAASPYRAPVAQQAGGQSIIAMMTSLLLRTGHCHERKRLAAALPLHVRHHAGSVAPLALPCRRTRHGRPRYRSCIYDVGP